MTFVLPLSDAMSTVDLVGESISYFSIAVIDTVAKGNLWKKVFKFGLMVKEG